MSKRENLSYLKNDYEEACERMNLKKPQLNDEYANIKEFLLNLLTDKNAIINKEYSATENTLDFMRIKFKFDDREAYSLLEKYHLYTLIVITSLLRDQGIHFRSFELYEIKSKSYYVMEIKYSIIE